jgi:hypothetical protein
MTNHEASRTLVKSAPELWAECSDAKSLARHLGAFGEIRITRLEPETAVAWEGDAASGTVRLEPSGWGTRVVLTATSEAAGAHPEPPELALMPELEPVARVPEATVVAGEAQATVATVDVDFVETEVAVATGQVKVGETEAPMATGGMDEEAPAPAAGLFARFREWLGRDRRREPKLPRATADEVPEADEGTEAADPNELPEANEGTEAADSDEPATVTKAPDELATVTGAEPDTRASEADEPAPVAIEEPGPTEGALAAALDSLGRAHHRPYSRS